MNATDCTRVKAPPNVNTAPASYEVATKSCTGVHKGEERENVYDSVNIFTQKDAQKQ